MSSSKSTLGIMLATAGSFFTGVAVGLLIAPKSGKESRVWIKRHADDLGHWVDEHSREAVHETEEKIKHIQDDVKKKIKDTIPDLYEATEDIHLSEEELIEREIKRS